MERHGAGRVALEASLSPQQALLWLQEDAHPLVLSGEWFGLGGVTVVGSEPARVADPWRDDPFALLAVQPQVADGEAVVGGGWAGWLGYGLGARIEALPPGPPPVVARPPFWLGFYDHVLLHDGQRWWFESLPTPGRAKALAERLELWRRRLVGAPPAGSRDARRLGPFRLHPGAAKAHLHAVAEAKERIAAGELFQANLCLRLEAELEGDDAVGLAARAFGEAGPRFGAFAGGTLSLSPERFLRRAGRLVTTEPIKGTVARSGDASAAVGERAALEGSVKDAAEHVMIVDLMRNDLGRVCRYGSVQAEPARTEPHAGVWHMVSTVAGELRGGVDDAALLRATFPPGSITGAPKVQAMKVIAELESSRREAYTGAVGMVSPLAGLDLNVAIRTFEFGEDRIWLGVGGGIVSDSDPEAELQEALTKAAGPIAVIGGRLERPAPTAASRQTPQAVALRHGARPDPALGIFETLLAVDGQPQQLERHLQRLTNSLSALYGVALSTDGLAELAAEVERAARAGTTLSAPPAANFAYMGAGGQRTRVRVLASPDGTLEVTAGPEPAPPGPEVAPLRLQPFVLPGGLGAHKWRDRRLLEALAASAPGTVPLLVEHDGTVLEAAYANVWVANGGELLTPPADGRILPGVRRAEMLAGEPTAREGQIHLDLLRAADAVFVTSAIARRPALLV